MEKVLSQEERIRRAEEIYNRRRQVYGNQYPNRFLDIDKTPSKMSIKKRLIKKNIFQCFICGLIYLCFWFVLKYTSFFSDDMKDKVNNFLSSDIEFSNLYSGLNTYINSDNNIIKKMFNFQATNTNENTSEECNEENNVISEDINAIGGADENLVQEDKTQTQTDVEYIKANYNIIWPLNGVITSKYGTRQASEIITANHYGIDIAGNTGDTIVAAMDGKVTLASTEGEYGEHLQITNGDVSTLYAHCSKLCVSQGTEVKQGEKIALVGQTGRATGPHLHFEIKYEDRTIDPQEILT